MEAYIDYTTFCVRKINKPIDKTIYLILLFQAEIYPALLEYLFSHLSHLQESFFIIASQQGRTADSIIVFTFFDKNFMIFSYSVTIVTDFYFHDIYTHIYKIVNRKY